MNNPSAFPRTLQKEYDTNIHEPGMTLRDYFAGQALNGELSTSFGQWNNNISGARACAEKCYRFADAMLKEREVNNGE